MDDVCSALKPEQGHWLPLAGRHAILAELTSPARVFHSSSSRRKACLSLNNSRRSLWPSRSAVKNRRLICLMACAAAYELRIAPIAKQARNAQIITIIFTLKDYGLSTVGTSPKR